MSDNLAVCPFCQTPVPSQALEARFCVECGRPVSQTCPYELGDEGPRVALRLSSGHPPLSCESCRNLFKVCHRCHRLHKLDDRECYTPGCFEKGRKTPLQEPSRTFASARGDLNGTGSADWNGSWTLQMPKATIVARSEPLQGQEVEELHQLAFRYGMLIGLTVSDLIIYSREGSTWAVKSRTALPLRISASAAQSGAGALLVDDGNAFILGEERSCAVAISGQSAVRYENSEKCVAHAKSARWWSRIAIEGHGQVRDASCVLRTTDCTRWDTFETQIPVGAPDVRDIVIASVGGDKVSQTDESETLIVVAAGKKGLVVAHPKQKYGTTWSHLPLYNWVRVAVENSVLLALGWKEEGAAVLMTLTMEGKIIKQHELSETYLSNFAWSGDTAYLFQDSTLMRFNTLQLSQQPQWVPLQEATQGVNTQFLVLRDTSAQNRLLGCRKGVRNGNPLYQPCLIVPESGAQIKIGGVVSEPPLLCVADSHLIVATHEGTRKGMKLRTYSITQESRPTL